ncbi:heterokaryon incompatibility protein-domain-containing protein [Staphylotrichum tortipilum]|uniref:Heterokaryon incompatibility protein-domain-containing protein n=1 Tax=Staphylotrichum tortipilum TaxID=2831512 RepID=A0AAN6RNI2_9PEZI|nr:heterokaryon incompatibility protein-domain-containing protein [Staphylotrichum longicolle]
MRSCCPGCTTLLQALEELGGPTPWDNAGDAPNAGKIRVFPRCFAVASFLSFREHFPGNITGALFAIEDPVLRTRVLRISPDPSSPITVLEPPAGTTGRYICLSYCWGKAAFIMTKCANIDRHKQGIPLADLPSTFRNLIHVARELEVEYLWIDALCIIQDDVDGADWKRESSRMADVYRNAYLTVTAAWADSADGGLFAAPGHGTAIGPSLTEVRVRRTDHFASATEFPVLKRGWIYQERLLSARVLYFGRHELLWECAHARTCECGQATYDAGNVEKFYLSDLATIGRSGYWFLPMTWPQMVAEYSPLQLTFGSDKLPAFSGLADYVGRRGEDRYLAGLWRGSLLVDIPDGVGRTPPYRAPTWSWASIDWRVQYNLGRLNRATVVLASVRKAKCSLAAGASPTGPVTDGFVVLSCVLHPARLEGGTLRTDAGELEYFSDRRRDAEGGGRPLYYIPMVTSCKGIDGIVVSAARENAEDMVRVRFAVASGSDAEWVRSEDENNLKRVRIV